MERPGDLLAPYIRKITKEFKDDSAMRISMRRVFSIKYNFSYTQSGLVVECEYIYKSFGKRNCSTLTKVFPNKVKDVFDSKHVSEVVINLQNRATEVISVVGFVFSDLWSIAQTTNINTTNGLRIEYLSNTLISDVDYLRKWGDAGCTTKVMPNWESIKNNLYNCFYGDIIIQDSGDGTFMVSSENYNCISSKNLSEGYLDSCYSLLKSLSNVELLKRQSDKINTIIVLNNCCNDKILYRPLGNGEYCVVVSFK